tara:strand:- start:181 stop:294 length:114 start_codon:yes stop_codon:yes gene_type:complete
VVGEINEIISFEKPVRVASRKGVRRMKITGKAKECEQ